MDPNEKQALLVLGLVRGLGPTLTRRCVQTLGSAQATLGASVSQLAQIQGIGQGKARSIAQGIDEEQQGDRLKQEVDLIQKHAVSLIAFNDPDYPKLLKHIPDPPMLLYVKGKLQEEDALAIGIVGARKCTRYGQEQAARFSTLCAQAGLCIISGGAYGIDHAAHQAALRNKSRTIAVIGSGHAQPYPQQHIPMFDQIAQGQGAVISEFSMTTKPIAENFPRRNRIVSGLSLGILVVEAAVRSGALITARIAAEDHSREVMAIPGPVDSFASSGCHKMIKEGWATLVTNAADVMDCLGEAGQILKASITQAPAHHPQNHASKNNNLELFEDSKVASNHASADNTPPGANPLNALDASLSKTQGKIVTALDSRLALDEICAKTGLTVGAVMADITMLEIRGKVRRVDGRFERIN